ncbi:MAG: signal peptidase II [Sphingomonas sp.]|uniref:Lipoprotein signal peptidase n=1 Tax=Sphingomonas lycopersici TaxID=2951807 RepID=A0AA41Z7Z1_9SPHN|nr:MULTISPECIES: signal peptidase II [Sphingomonas]MBV8238149.1 signal peptidase II [Sphingomonas sp.]MCW6529553.1 signal peptidase II [Sphingomonas lycopersici]MCW6534524.1 signal peptidase II [Sphingomonas lycopersici]OJU22949.1 MAG: signal peptidase II [Sphingomonas sp. 66-10]
MRALPKLGLATALALFLVDQLVKWIVTGPLGIDYLGAVREILPIFDLRFVQNVGVSLGLLRAESEVGRWALVAMTGAIAVAVLVWMWREKSRADQVALGLVLGGAIGNILDRVRFGYVVDFADLHFGEWRPFLVFNVADAAITIGVLILLVRALLMRDKPGKPVENR